MFTGLRKEPIPYVDPWTHTLDERIAALCARERRIAYFYERPDTSTFRYRVLNMIQALDAEPEYGISASYFSRVDLPQLHRFIDRADALVICRTRYDSGVCQLIARARRRGLPVIFDTDDLVFDSDYVHLLLDTLDQPMEGDHVWDHWFGWIGRVGATLRMCDRAILTNEFLAARLQDFAPGMPTHVIPNFLNWQQQAECEKIWAHKVESGFARNDKIHVGYFSGTPTHNRDFEIASGALANLLENDRRVVIRMVGFMEPKGRLSAFNDRIEVHPLQDFLNLQPLIGEVELNIAPLQSNTFTNCKSELKYFEAAMVGTLTVATPTYTFSRAIRDGVNGFLAYGHEWEKKLSEGMATLDSRDEYRRIVTTAFHGAREQYRWDRFAPQIAAAVFP